MEQELARGDRRIGTKTCVVVLCERAGGGGVFAEEITGVLTRKGGITAKQGSSIIFVFAQWKGGSILWRAGESAGRDSGRFGDCAYSCECEEGDERVEREMRHLYRPIYRD